MTLCKLGFCKVQLTKENKGGSKSTICIDCKEKLKGVAETTQKGYNDSYPKWVIKTIHRSKKRSESKGRDFQITSLDIMEVWPENNTCPILGTEFVSNASRDVTPSIDRIDNSKGYVKGNIQIISGLANRMKNSASPEQLRLFSKYYIERE